MSVRAIDSYHRPQPNTADAPWINVVTHLDSQYGGMSSAVPSLSSAVAHVGKHTTTLAGFCTENEQFSRSPASNVPAYLMPLSRGRWFADKRPRELFRNLVRASSGVHIHGLWENSTLIAAHSARQAGKPYVVSAHGMLQPWALNNKRWKKAIYGALIERRTLQNAACLHALTEAEAKDYRAYGLNKPIAVIPNGVTVPVNSDAALFLNYFPGLRGKRLVLFLGRIHFKKGLDILCSAWTGIANRYPDAHLVLAGPDFEHTRKSTEIMLSEAGTADRVTFTGMLGASLKWSALRAASCFVLPSYSEGLSVSILEALATSLPVIVTRQCNLPEVSDCGCGWVIEPTAGELQAALSDCLTSPASALAQMGANGSRLVSQEYSWHVIGNHMSALYDWLEGGPVPDQFPIHFGAHK